MRTRLRLALLMLLLALAPGCTEPDSSREVATSAVPSVQPRASASPSLDPRVGQIRTQGLDPLFSALRKGDLQKLAGLVHPEAKKGVDVAVERLASGYEAMAVQDLKYSSGETVKKVTGSDAQSIAVEGSYRIRGLEGRYEFEGNLSFLESASEWKLTRLDWQTVPVWRVPGPLTRSVSDGAVVFHPPDFPGEELAGLAEEGVDRIGKVATSIRPPYLIVVAGEDYQTMAPSRSAGLALTRISWTGERFEWGVPYVVVNGNAYLRADAGRRRSIVLHELTHALLAQEAVFFTPTWLSEGLAVYYSGGLDLGALKPNGSEAHLDKMKLKNMGAELTSHFEPNIADAYAYAGAVVSVLTERFGEDAVLELHRSYGTALPAEKVNEIYSGPFFMDDVRDRVERDLGHSLTEKLFAERFQLSVDEVDTAAREWVRARW